MNSKFNEYEELMEAKNNEILDLKEQLRQLKKRSHISDGTTPNPVRKKNMISLFRQSVGSAPNMKINLQTRLYIMKLLRRGCSYRQVIGVLDDIKILIPKDLVHIGSTPCMGTVHKIFIEFALLVKMQIAKIFDDDSKIGHSTDETPDLDGCPILASCIQDLQSGKNI